MVNQLFSAKKQPPSSPFSNGEFSNADTSALEKQIDEMIYKLYGLTPEEIAVVEGKNERTLKKNDKIKMQVFGGRA